MAITVTEIFNTGHDNRSLGGAGSVHMGVYSVAMDDSYPTGGEALDFTSSSVASPVFSAQYIATAFPASGFVPEYDLDNSKLKAFYADYDGSADGALIECANATDLDGVTFIVLVIGNQAA